LSSVDTLAGHLELLSSPARSDATSSMSQLQGEADAFIATAICSCGWARRASGRPAKHATALRARAKITDGFDGVWTRLAPKTFFIS
jgi:hypothetical protein